MGWGNFWSCICIADVLMYFNFVPFGFFQLQSIDYLWIDRKLESEYFTKAFNLLCVFIGVNAFDGRSKHEKLVGQHICARASVAHICIQNEEFLYLNKLKCPWGELKVYISKLAKNTWDI